MVFSEYRVTQLWCKSRLQHLSKSTCTASMRPVVDGEQREYDASPDCSNIIVQFIVSDPGLQSSASIHETVADYVVSLQIAKFFSIES